MNQDPSSGRYTGLIIRQKSIKSVLLCTLRYALLSSFGAVRCSFGPEKDEKFSEPLVNGNAAFRHMILFRQIDMTRVRWTGRIGTLNSSWR